jgi:hypothetical protein
MDLGIRYRDGLLQMVAIAWQMSLLAIGPVWSCFHVNRSRIHERTISLRFQDIILRVLRLEVSLYNVYITNQFQTTFSGGGGG